MEMEKKMDSAAKAAAIEAKAKAEAQYVADREAARTAIVAKAGEMGGQYAAGNMSLTHLAYLYSDAARLGYATEGDATDLYRAFVAGNNAAVDAGMVTVGNQQFRVSGAHLDGNDKSPANNLRTFARLAAAIQGLGLYEAIIRVRKPIDRELVAGSEYVCMVRVNRALSKIADDKAMTEADIRAGGIPFPTDDELRVMCSKEAKDPKSFGEKLDAVCTALKALVKKDEALPIELRKVWEDAVKALAAHNERASAAKAKADRIAAAPTAHTLPANAETTVEKAA